jgi:hypothetical protein
MRDQGKPYSVKKSGIPKPGERICQRCGERIKEVRGVGFGSDAKEVCGCPPVNASASKGWGG